MNIIFYFLKIMTSLPEIRKNEDVESGKIKISKEENLNIFIMTDLINELREIKAMVMNINEFREKILIKIEVLIENLKSVIKIDKNFDKTKEPDSDSSIKNKINVSGSSEDETIQSRLEQEFPAFESFTGNKSSTSQFESANRNQIVVGIHGSFDRGEIKSLADNKKNKIQDSDNVHVYYGE
ncbi:hypothetical protein DMUE_5178 [Dictyocoela muelleri]|nr:hypothetical protein DMUE_5178 [Dictyocoela muelleri]